MWRCTGSKHVQDIKNTLKVIGSDLTVINGHIKTAFLVTWKWMIIELKLFKDYDIDLMWKKEITICPRYALVKSWYEYEKLIKRVTNYFKMTMF